MMEDKNVYRLRKKIYFPIIKIFLLLGIIICAGFIILTQKIEPSFTNLLFIIFIFLVTLTGGVISYLYLKKKILRPLDNIIDLFYGDLKKSDFLEKTNISENNCFQILDCPPSKRDSCPAYLNKKVKCWLLSQMQGFRKRKDFSCKSCKVYQDYRGNEIERVNDLFYYLKEEVWERLKELKEKEKIYLDNQRKLKENLEEGKKTIETLHQNLNNALLRLEELRKEFDEFIYITSHDLREPLRIIEAFGKFLNEDYSNLLDEKGREYLSILIESTQKMRSKITDLWDLSKLSIDIYEKERFNLGKVLEKSLINLEGLIKEKKANISYNDINVEVYGNPDMVEKVLSNLISNGIKFNNKKEINIEVGSIKGNDMVTVYVKDNGIGIRDLYYDKIFQIFQRLNPENNYPGNGVGLTVCKKIIEKHNGSIWLESKQGEGTTFYFTLPYEE